MYYENVFYLTIRLELIENKDLSYLHVEPHPMERIFLAALKGRVQVLKGLLFLDLGQPKRRQRLLVLFMLQILYLFMQCL